MKRIVQILLGIIALALPQTAEARTELTDLTATSNYLETIGLGKPSDAYTWFEITPEDAAYPVERYWMKKDPDNGAWGAYNDPLFVPGTYCYMVKIYASYKDYYLSEDWTFTVNGIEWYTFKAQQSYAETWGWAQSPDIEINRNEMSEFTVTSNYKDIIGYGKEVTTPTVKNISNNIVSIPENSVGWLKKNETDGKFYTYTGSTFEAGSYRMAFKAVVENDFYMLPNDWKVRVKGAKEDIYCLTDAPNESGTEGWAYVPVSVAQQDTRTNVVEVVASSNYHDIIRLGKKAELPSFALEEGSIVTIPENNIRVQKKDDNGNWTNYFISSPSTYVQGTYRIIIRARIDDPGYAFSNNWELAVNHTMWNTEPPYNGETYCTAEATSPEIELNESGVDNVSADTTDAPTNVYNLQGIVVKRDATDLSGLPAGLYIIGGKKVLKK